MARRHATRPLGPMLELMAAAERARFMPRWSFPHALSSKHWQQRDSGGGYLSYDDGLRYGYRVPADVCSSDGVASTSALLAVMDEATSWAGIGADKARRPGVSVSLSLELLGDAAPVAAGETLIFTSHVQKLGRSMGLYACAAPPSLPRMRLSLSPSFLLPSGAHLVLCDDTTWPTRPFRTHRSITCEVSRESTGELVAVGRHTKFLDMGRLWSFAFGTAYPLTRSAGQLVARTEPPGRPAGVPSGPELDVRPPDAVDAASTRSSGGGSVVSTVVCAAHHLNGVPAGFGDGVHGGCQAMIHEAAARNAVGLAGLTNSISGGTHGGRETGSDAESAPTPPRLLSLEVTYLSSARPVPLACAVAPLRSGPIAGSAGGLIRASSQLRPRDGSAADAPLSEAQMTFRV